MLSDGATNLVYVEFHSVIAEAIFREEWRRAWKIMLIEDGNPALAGLVHELR
jgi:predicted GIY-YIG superfamily endonuclease